MTVCKTCHDEHHGGIDVIPIKAITQFKAETFMSSVHLKLINLLNCEHTFGYITKHNRIGNSIEKSHINDAFVISGGNGQRRCKSYTVMQTRRNNRALQLNRKGFKPSIRKQRYKLQPNDLVKFEGKGHRVKGVHSYGSRVLLHNKKSVAIGKTELIKYGKGMCYA